MQRVARCPGKGDAASSIVQRGTVRAHSRLDPTDEISRVSRWTGGVCSVANGSVIRCACTETTRFYGIQGRAIGVGRGHIDSHRIVGARFLGRDRNRGMVGYPIFLIIVVIRSPHS